MGPTSGPPVLDIPVRLVPLALAVQDGVQDGADMVACVDLLHHEPHRLDGALQGEPHEAARPLVARRGRDDVHVGVEPVGERIHAHHIHASARSRRHMKRWSHRVTVPIRQYGRRGRRMYEAGFPRPGGPTDVSEQAVVKLLRLTRSRSTDVRTV